MIQGHHVEPAVETMLSLKTPSSQREGELGSYTATSPTAAGSRPGPRLRRSFHADGWAHGTGCQHSRLLWEAANENPVSGGGVNDGVTGLAS